MFSDYDGTREFKDESDLNDGNSLTEAKQKSPCNHTSVEKVESKQLNYNNLVANMKVNAAEKGSDEVDSPVVTPIPDCCHHEEKMAVDLQTVEFDFLNVMSQHV